MKPYKRQKLAVFAILLGMSMASTSFAAVSSSVHVNDVVSKPIVTKMPKDATLEIKQSKGSVTKKRARKTPKHKNTNTQTVSSKTTS